VKETWKTYPHNDNYEISDRGKVRRARDLGIGGRFKRGGLLKPARGWGQYLNQILWRKGKPQTLCIHRLVLETFISDRPYKMQCDHKDGNKFNNKLNNLEWVTCSENEKRAYRLGLKIAPKLRGEQHGMAKLKEGDVIAIRKLHQKGLTQKDIAKKFNNVGKRHIFKIISKEVWKHL
jgi:hypothetical protein